MFFFLNITLLTKKHNLKFQNSKTQKDIYIHIYKKHRIYIYIKHRRIYIHICIYLAQKDIYMLLLISDPQPPSFPFQKQRTVLVLKKSFQRYVTHIYTKMYIFFIPTSFLHLWDHLCSLLFYNLITVQNSPHPYIKFFLILSYVLIAFHGLPGKIVKDFEMGKERKKEKRLLAVFSMEY